KIYLSFDEALSLKEYFQENEGASLDQVAGRICFGINRKSIRAVSAPDVERGLGFEIGGVGPFPVALDMAVVLDQSLMDLPYVFCGSGRNTITIEISPGGLAVAGRARVAAIRKP
ncbi:MAG: YbaK/EbsC family protein, partial [Desulfobacterales bacterium]|nr:YbaK/EbsC family protein [Desulfobacterales bacterium]